MILIMRPCLPLINNQHHRPKPDSSISVAVIKLVNWSNTIIAVLPSCALVSSSYLLHAFIALTDTLKKATKANGTSRPTKSPLQNYGKAASDVVFLSIFTFMEYNHTATSLSYHPN